MGLKKMNRKTKWERETVVERGENSVRESEMKEMWSKLKLFTRNDGCSGKRFSVVTAILHYELRRACQG